MLRTLRLAEPGRVVRNGVLFGLLWFSTLLDAAIHRGQVLAGLDQTREFADIDWPSVVNRIEELRAEKRELEAASSELARLNRELETVREQIGVTEAAHGELANDGIQVTVRGFVMARRLQFA